MTLVAAAGLFCSLIMGCQGALPPHDEKNDVIIVLSPPAADSGVAPIDAGDASTMADSSSVDASDAAKPMNAHCQKLADDYLVLPPEKTGACDKTACAKAGGECAYAGFCFGNACIRKSKDGSRACTDGSQCESKACIAATGAKPGAGGGTCSTVVLTLGCHVMVSRGQIARVGLCGD